ncbi:hypothetical protein BDY24DRAFT_436776 [Mrakia frigida]|uniref:uncharacterized protein n=1 Tax=Mrakia frigida TaxID=29902 RepID=UPI003FCC1FD2
MRSSFSSRAHFSLLLLVFATFTLLVLTSTSTLAYTTPHRSLVDHWNPSRALLSDKRAYSPRPTPEPRPDSLSFLMATYNSNELPELVSKRAGACYGSGTTAAQINNYFATNRALAGVLLLCPGAVLSITQTILFTAANQGIQTEGGSAVPLASRARLNLVNASISTVIQASNCAYCNDLLLDNLIIDGGRVALGSLAKGAGLLELGGISQRHTVTNCQLQNCRGWTSLHFTEGSGNSCVGAIANNNVIGPSGDSYDVGKAADGISLSCRGSTIQGNTIFDATDGAIVIFGSPGSDVSGNIISSVNKVLLGGINMVDYAPWAGDCKLLKQHLFFFHPLIELILLSSSFHASDTGVLVHDNSFTASGAQMKIGIAQGLVVWTDRRDVNFGAAVYSNTFGGADMTFGMAVAGVQDWSVTENTALASARFRGNLLCYVADTTSPGEAPNSAFIPGGTCTAPEPPDAATSDWRSSGYCLQDSAVRILVGQTNHSTSNTIGSCTSFCTQMQFYYAGVENGNQCFCSNAIAQGPGFGYPRATSTCNKACTGNPAELCGGLDYGLFLYYDASRIAAPLISSPSSSSSFSTSSRASTSVTSSRSSSTVSRSSTSISSSRTSSTFSRSSTSISTSTSSSTISPSSTTSSRSSTLSSSTTPSPSALPPSHGYSSLGCIQDVSSYVLQGYNFASNSMTVALCTSTCQSRSFAYAGLEYGQECRCGNSIVTSGGGGLSLKASSCSMSCAGDSTSKCGGWYAISLYYSSSIHSSVSVSSKSVAASPTSSASIPSSSGWSSGTCLTDDSSRLLTGISTSSSSMTPAACQSYCSAYAYAGTEFSTQCYCGNYFTATSGHGQPSTGCSSSCAGDSSQKCGGSWAIRVYSKSSSSPSWSSTSCVTDGANSNRLLKSYYFQSSSMTNALCQSTCQSRSYVYAATQYSNECYCSNTLSTSSTAGQASTSCNSQCAGDSTQICGGSYAASLSTFA